ncbi:MAG TPA: ABC transporter permease [Candidatus Hydrogenedens sp.]|nr:ABC transporter permease [Candidatus Hydrogenedens sp.]HOK09064.1 ABC transporter permease [Candidatus Hydrogenedens sp.]HPP58772.1 ABC transporter permease [Candidatus Hydrogenedens sp.]
MKVLRRELHIIAHSPFYYLFTFILPIISFIILYAIFYQEIPRDLPIVVCNYQNSELARQIIRSADASASLKVALVTPNFQEGEQWLKEGRAYAMIYIPKNIEQKLMGNKEEAVVAFYNNQWMLTSSLISRALREVIGKISYQEEFYFRSQKGEPANYIPTFANPIALDSQPLYNPNLNYRFFLLPALLPSMIQAFIIMVMIRAFGSELKYGTVKELMDKAGGNYWIAIIGKSIPYTIAFSVLTLFMLTLLVYGANVPFEGDLSFVIVSSILFVLAYQSIGFAFVTLTSNLRMANSLGGFYAGPAFAFAGITYPVIGMPLPAKIWSYSLPITYYLKILLEQAIRGMPTWVSVTNMIILFLFFFIPLLILAPRWQRFATHPEYWGKI